MHGAYFHTCFPLSLFILYFNKINKMALDWGQHKRDYVSFYDYEVGKTYAMARFKKKKKR